MSTALSHCIIFGGQWGYTLCLFTCAVRVDDDSSRCDLKPTLDTDAVYEVTGHVINLTTAAADRCSHRL